MNHHQDAKITKEAPRKDLGEELERVGAEVVDAAIKVHSALGPGLLESVYEACLGWELESRGLRIERQVAFPIRYGEVLLASGLRVDCLVEGKVILELKSVEAILPIHEAQLLSYLRLSELKLGFLLNFNVPLMKEGIRRRVL